MTDGFPPRFAVEAGFLILLAVGLGLADLRPALIVGVMAGGWLLVSLIELLAWRAATAPQAVVELPAAEPAPGWDVEEILVPEAETGAPEEPEALTTVLAAEPEPPVEPEAVAEPEAPAEEKPKRRRRARRSE